MKRLARPDSKVFGEAWSRLTAPAVAHRGLWSPGGAPENSLAAFSAAASRGFGIELDVHLSSDGEAMVFHDETLKRMTGHEGRIADHTAADLGHMRLGDSDETIPTLAETLVEVGHRSLVHIELKTAFGQVGPLEKRVSEILLDHRGPTCVIGFNPYSHAWFADHHPQVMRGLDSYAWNDRNAEHLAVEQRKSFAALEHVHIARPDFLALHAAMLPSEAATSWRQNGLPIVAWTVRSSEEQKRIAPHCDNIIFEGFDP
jgi:glycerophosphoryl diester phosphodiesterase